MKLQGAKFHQQKSIRHHFKDKILVNPTTMSDFMFCFRRKAFFIIMLGQQLVTESIQRFSIQREESQKAEMEIK